MSRALTRDGAATKEKTLAPRFPSASFLRKQEPSVFLFTDKRKKKKPRRWIPDQVRDDEEGKMQIPSFDYAQDRRDARNDYSVNE